MTAGNHHGTVNRRTEPTHDRPLSVRQRIELASRYGLSLEAFDELLADLLVRSLAAEDPPAYYTRAALAKRYGLSLRHFDRLLKEGRFPPPARFGSLLRWMPGSIHAWEARGFPPCDDEWFGAF